MRKFNKEGKWHVLRIYMGGQLLHSIKRLYVNSLACVRVKEDENKCFTIDSMRDKIISGHLDF